VCLYLSVCVCVCVRERERESVCESVFVCLCCMYVCVCVYVCERERERDRQTDRQRDRDTRQRHKIERFSLGFTVMKLLISLVCLSAVSLLVPFFSSSIFCRTGLVELYCLNLVLSWNILVSSSIVINIWCFDYYVVERFSFPSLSIWCSIWFLFSLV
jgi:Ca2+/Na+ antiporter